jgi:phosphatidylserine/phosphatidylglycerophosphate/cardiolipin synthase-like enzyme/thiamine monophosphate kinase
MPRIGMRRVSLAVATVTLAATSGLAGSTVAAQAATHPAVTHSAGTHPAATHPAATNYLTLQTLPDQGETALYNFLNTATSSIDVTIYELNDVTMENELVAKEKAGVTVRVILDQAQKSYNTAAYNVLTAGGVGVVYSSTSFTYTHQKTITVNNDESYVSTGNFDNTYYATSRDFGVFDTDPTDVAAIVAVFNADYAHTSITPSDGDDLVWSPTDSQTQLLALINGAQHTLDIEQEEFEDTTLTNAIVADAKRGVTVRIVVEDPSDYTTDLNEVTAAGGTYVGYSSSTGFYIHGKSVIVDSGYSDAKAFVGSENFSSNSLSDNRELGIITTDSNIVSGLETTFNGDYSGSNAGKVAIFSPGNQTTATGGTVYLQTQGEDTCTGTFSYKATGLPTGLSISSTTGVISGTASKAGTYTVTVTGTDTTGPSASATYTWTVGTTTGNTVTVTNPGSQTGTVGTPASLQVSATDSASGQTLTYSATGLPAGLSINASTGLISGTPTTATAYSVTVTATDTTGAKGSASFTWTINPATANTVTVTNPGSQTGTVGTPASLQVSATDSASGQTLTYSATGLPAGLSINASTGLISGTPTTATAYSVTVTATDTTGAKGSATFTWTISASSSCTAAQLLGNPGFENGSSSPAPWTVTSTHSPVEVINDSSKEPPHSGTWDAWLDGWGTTTTDTVSQPVSVPSGCSTYQLSFWLHIDTAETTTTTAYDTLKVQVLNSSGTVLGTLATFSNLNHNTGYAQHTYNVSAYAGESITLKFTGSEDSEKQTSFVLDDTAFNVS